jgi:hypothetical protein
MYFFLLIAIIFISQAGLYAVELEKRSFFILYFLRMYSFTLPSSKFRRAVQTKDPMLWNVGLQTDSSDIPIRNKYVNSNRIPVSGGGGGGSSHGIHSTRKYVIYEPLINSSCHS